MKRNTLKSTVNIVSLCSAISNSVLYIERSCRTFSCDSDRVEIKRTAIILKLHSFKVIGYRIVLMKETFNNVNNKID